jgi:ribosomal protein S18 acetylase RimI-like enzyme
MDEIIVSPADNPDVAVRCDRGVSLVPAKTRARHRPDRSLVAIRGGSLVARCSCWWNRTPLLDGQHTGLIGHYAAFDRDAGTALLGRACEILAAAGCSTAMGPLDGSTWRSYRFVVARGNGAPFFLEPDQPESWPAHWSDAGFSPRASYTSAVDDELEADDSDTSAARARLSDAGIAVRAFDPQRAERELHLLFGLSAVSFSGNFLYSPISEEEFLEQHRALLPVVRPELLLLAEQAQRLVGFVVALPDMLQATRGVTVDTAIIKTIAVHPACSGMGVGGALVALVQRRARQLGFRRAIHALMHDDNVSRRISARYARPFRRYVLLSRPLGR